ncbi:S-layer homology domain-containing protein [Aedoeadaptatus urinae]|uniref:S-layer homology domain-containing protein n=1 Tax=Aedoeadaptatus urinae TaxID=1871017 RepID=UPI00097D6E15|nr:S-layer homology domain-containing protein [Peptoniphilus urinae]
MKKKRALVALTLAALTLVIQSPAAYAARFKDVGTNHWAYSYISEMADRKVLSGYPDGTFKPDNYVTLPEIFLLIKGVKQPSESALSQAKLSYGDLARACHVPDWAVESAAYAMDRGIITPKQLKAAQAAGQFKTKGITYPARKEVAAYYARALNLKGMKDHSDLKVKDLAQIGTVSNEIDVQIPAADYVAALVKEGVLAAEGSDGYFRGDRPVRRSEMAKISKKAGDYAPTAQATEDVVMYTKEGCKYCVMAKTMFRDKLHRPFVEKDISKDPEALHEFKEKGYSFVPVIISDGKVVEGYKPDEIMALFDNPIK